MDIIQTVELITGVLNRTFVSSIKFYDLKKIKNLTPYFPTSFITTGSAIANPKNTKRYLRPDEIKKLTIYDNSAFIFFLTGKESEPTKTLLSFIKNKGEAMLEGKINFNTKYKYPLVCVIMTLEAENMYLAQDNPICSNMFISMKETSNSVYDHQNPTIRTKVQGSILNKIKSYNLAPEENTYALSIPIKTLSLNQKENKESLITILKTDQYSKKLSEELEISLEK